MITFLRFHLAAADICEHTHQAHLAAADSCEQSHQAHFAAADSCEQPYQAHLKIFLTRSGYLNFADVFAEIGPIAPH